MTSTATTSTPTQEQVEDFLLSCRYGELAEVQTFVEQFGANAVVQARDDRGNTAVHMCCGNGHTDVLKYLLPSLPASLLTATNENGSPPLHWAILNNHVAIVQLLVDLPEEQGGGLPILKQKNRQDRDAFMESIFAGEGKEEVSGWIEGYLYKAEGGDDEGIPAGEEEGRTTEIKGDGVDEVTEQTEEVTLKDA